MRQVFTKHRLFSSFCNYRAGKSPRHGSSSLSPRTKEYSSSTAPPDDKRKKVVVLLGATGSGKTRLSIDLAAHFNGEIINSDKIQLYKGLDITTNKIPLDLRRGVRHHLLGYIDPSRSPQVISPSRYRSLASPVVSDISARSKLPILAGGSNSFVHALLAERYPPVSDVFNGPVPVTSEPNCRYDCCFLWMDAAPWVLDAYLEKRVDHMMQSGMLQELAHFYTVEGVDSGTRPGLRMAIGVLEFRHYFRRFPFPSPENDNGGNNDLRQRKEMVDEAVRAMKDNTCQRARAQMDKIQRLRELSWNLRRIETTDIFHAIISSESDRSKADAVYREQVLPSAMEIVRQFLRG